MGLFDMDPAKAEMLTQLGLGLMGGTSPHFGQNLLQASMFAQEQANKKRLAKEQEEMKKLQLEQTQMQLAQQRQQQEQQAQVRSLGQQYLGGGLGPGQAGPPTAPNPMAFAQGLGAIDPMQSLQLQQSLTPKPQGPMKMGKDDRLVDPSTGKELVSPAPDHNQMIVRGPNGPMINPLYVQAKSQIAAAGRPQVNVDMKQEGEFGKAMGKNFAENYNDLLKSGAGAGAKMQTLTRFGNILDKTPTGKLEPMKAEIGRTAASLGFKVDTDKLSAQDALEALSNEFALTLRNPSGGAGMPGALSDKDRDFLVSMVPTLGKTPGGNRMILEAFKRVAQREAEVAKLAREYKQKTGRFDEGFYDELAKRFGSQDILSDLAAKAGASAPQQQFKVIGVERG